MNYPVHRRYMCVYTWVAPLPVHVLFDGQQELCLFSDRSFTFQEGTINNTAKCSRHVKNKRDPKLPQKCRRLNIAFKALNDGYQRYDIDVQNMALDFLKKWKNNPHFFTMSPSGLHYTVVRFFTA